MKDRQAATAIAAKQPTKPNGGPGKEKLLLMYRMMRLVRRFEEQVNLLFVNSEVPGTVHLYTGQEAVAVGVCSALRTDDYITSTHRPHGHAVAKGIPVRNLMAELFARAPAAAGAMAVPCIWATWPTGCFPL